CVQPWIGVENAIAHSQDCLRCDPPTNSESRLPVVPLDLERGAWSSVDAREKPSTQQWVLQTWISPIVDLTGVWICTGKAEAGIDPIVLLMRRCIHVPTKPNIQRKIGADL